MKKHHITLTVNGDDYDALVEPQRTLLDTLRDTLMLTVTKEGCATGDCGACTVMVDGVEHRSACTRGRTQPDGRTTAIRTNFHHRQPR